MTSMGLRASILGALAIMLLACGGQSSAAVLGGTISYSRSGGFAGVSERMRISPAGEGRIGTHTFRLPSKERRDLAAAIRRANLASFRSPRRADCCDMLYYAIRYRGRRVAWDDSSSHRVPERILDLYSRLADVYERYS
jgi:hypothetical protein